jgi:hypothetical protein
VRRWAWPRNSLGWKKEFSFVHVCTGDSKAYSVKSRNCVAMQHTASGVEVIADMIEQQILEKLLGRLVCVLGDLLECGIGWGKDSVVCLRAVKNFYQIIVLVDELSKLSGVLALANKLIYGKVRFPVVTMVRLAVVWRPMVGRSMVWGSIMRRVVWVVRVFFDLFVER